MISLRHHAAATGLVFAVAAVSASAVNENLHVSVASVDAGDEYGFAVASIGDMNNDGIADVLIGVPGRSVEGITPGAAVIISGDDGSQLRTVEGDQDGERFGHAVASLGDISGDGIDDFVIGAPFRDLHGDDAGVARVYSGATGTQLFLLSELLGPDQRFGSAVGSAGDVNGDGTTDIVVGAPFTDAPGDLAAGAIYVYSGVDGSLLASRLGNQAFAFLGFDVAALGDVNGDGKSEVLLAFPGIDNFGVSSNSGRVQVWDVAANTILYGVTGNTPGDEFGRAVDVVGDIDGDGRNDFAVGAWGRDGAVLELGSFNVYSGLDGSPLTGGEILGTQRAELFGTSVAGVGDVDGDLTPDIAVGAFAHDAGGSATSSGAVRVYSGADFSLLFEVVGGAANRRLGWAVAGGRDHDGDGQADVILGAPQRPFDATDAARVHIYTFRAVP